MDGQTLKIIHALLREQALLGVFRHADRDAEPARDIRRALVMVRMMMGQEHLVDAEAIDQAAQPVHLLVIGRRWIDEDAMRLRVTEQKTAGVFGRRDRDRKSVVEGKRVEE